MAEFQVGNIPGETPENVASVYEQLNLEYRLKGFNTSVRLENYYSNDSVREGYTKISQYTFSYRKRGLSFKAGNFYETLGKGLLYRGYEIKNSVYEDQIYRVKHGFYRDLQGAFGSYSNRFFLIKAMRGKSLINELPPNSPDNRLDLVSASELVFNLSNQKAGLIFLQNENEFELSKYLSTHFGGSIGEKFDYYGEFAHRINTGDDFFSTGSNDSYGAYFQLSYSMVGFGASFEIKDYQNLFIGSGISDPPTLVKEHFYRLLNRSTHVPFYFDESGLQIEIFIVPAANQIITINHSRSKNDLGDSPFRSAEYFADWHFTSKNNHQVKIFADYSFDEILAETARFASGLYYSHILPKSWTLNFESEFQQLERTFEKTSAFQNVYLGLGASKSTRFTANLIFEFTNDDKYSDNINTAEIETRQLFPGVNISYKPNYKNTLNLFAGKRRGGPACTSGVCYEVLDFKGVELRWTIKL